MSAVVRWPAISANELPLVLLRAIEAAAHGITIADSSDDHRLVYVNPAFVRMTGYSAQEALGRNCGFLQGPDTAPNSAAEIREALRAGRDISLVLRNYRRDGSAFWNEISICAVREGTGRITHFVGTQIDVTERIERERDLVHLAHTDPLTGLDNRNQLSAELDALLAGPSTDAVAVIFVDVEGFHWINEDFDFQTGNLVLAGIAERLTGISSEQDLLARLDADSFVLVRPACPDQCAAAAEQCVTDIQQAMRVPIVTTGVTIPARVNCGIARYPADGDSAAALIQAARRAMEIRRDAPD